MVSVVRRGELPGFATGSLLKLNCSVRQCNQQDADGRITITSVFCATSEVPLLLGAVRHLYWRVEPYLVRYAALDFSL